MKVDMKPVHPVGPESNVDLESSADSEFMLAKCNFHRDLEVPASVTEILGILGCWDAATNYASTLAAGFSSQR